MQGASGGVGASVLTAATAGRAAAAGLLTCAVDACPWGGGLDLLLGLDGVAGARWSDLTTMRSPRGEALLAELPGAARDGHDTPAVLSWDPAPPVEVPEPWSVVPALRSCRDVVLVDLPPAGGACWQEWVGACDQVVLVVGAGLDCLRPARTVVEAPGEYVGLLVRTRPDGVDPEWISAALGVPVLAEVGEDRSVATDLLRGRAVGRAGQVARAAEQVLAELMPLALGGGEV